MEGKRLRARSQRRLPITHLAVERISQVPYMLVERRKLRRRLGRSSQERVAKASRARCQSSSLARQGDDDLPLICWVARPCDQVGGFEAFEDRGHRTGFECQFVSNFSYGLVVGSPQDIECEVLRISKPEVIQQGLVEALDRHACRVNCIAELVVERDRFVVGGGIHECSFKPSIRITIAKNNIAINNSLTGLLGTGRQLVIAAIVIVI